MKKHLLLFAICLMAISVSLQAQKRSHHGGKHHVEKMKKDLDLSDEQAKQIEEMGASLKEEMIAIKSSDLEMDEKHIQMKALGDKKKAMMDKILTVEQKQKMDEIHADKKEKHKERKAEMKEKHKAMKQFMQEKVKPFITAQRAKLDKEIKKKDRKEIDKLRAIAKDFRTEMKEKHEAMKEKFKKGERPEHFERSGKGKKGMHGKPGMHHRGPKGQRGHEKKMMMEFKKSHEATYKQAAEFATKYASEIDQIMEESHTQTKAWMQEMRGDVKGERGHSKKGAACCEGKKAKKGAACCEDKGTKGKGDTCCESQSACKKAPNSSKEPKTDKHQEKKQMERIGFLLMPSEIDETKSKEFATIAFLESKVYPNPSSNSNTLEINVAQKGQYLIELYNETGSKLRLISNSKLEKGNYTFQVDLSDLPTGLYYYVITDGKDKTTQKFIKN